METREHPQPSELNAAREALEEHRWSAAFELLSTADAKSPLEPEQLRALAQAAWFTARADLAVELKERAFKGYLDRCDRVHAAAVALDVSYEYSMKRMGAIAGAWFARGERLLENEPESFAHGYLALARSQAAELRGDADAAASLAGQAIDIGARFGEADLQAWGLIRRGTLLIKAGRTDEGFLSMEEATIAAVNGELTPFVTGVAYCSMIAACRHTTDYRRASEWTEAAHRWCERQAINGFPGVCRVHRAEIMALQGGLERAELELQQATEEIAAYNATPPLADGFYALGEIRMRLGDLASAEEALRQAHSLGRSPQPALALIRLAQGKVAAALSAIDAAVAEESSDRWVRARLLPAQVEIAVAARELAPARSAAEELSEIAETFASPALHASAHDAWGRVRLAEGDAEGAARELREGIRSWREVAAPYEIARDRTLLAAALKELGLDDDARLELDAALREFEGLGAALDVARLAELVQGADDRSATPVQVRRTFVFTDIVSSTNLAEAMGDEAWEHLLRWHDDTLSALISDHGGEVVNRTGDGFFAAFDSSGDAVRSAVAIQRALAEHRRTHGFAPGVRIGLHVADANQRSGDYSGKGVHVAARIAALAGAGEIFASTDTVAQERPYPVSDARSVSLKGVADDVDIVSILWS